MKRGWTSRRGVLVAAGLAVAAAAVAYFRLSGEVPVDVYAVRYGRVEEITPAVAAGTVKSPLESVLSTETGGRIVLVRAKEGTMVSSGELLARIDDPELSRQIEGARAEEAQARDGLLQSEARREEAAQRVRAEMGRAENNVRKAREDHRRMAELFRDGFASRSELDLAETLLANTVEESRIAASGEASLRAIDREIDSRRGQERAARSRVEALSARRAKLEIVAPFSGVVTRKSAEIGENKLPGSPLFVLADPSRIHVEAQVDEADAAKVRVGQSVRLLPEAFRGEPFTGKVSEVRPTVEASKEVSRANTILVSLVSAPRPLRLGMSVDVEVLTGGKDNVLMIPSASIMERDGKKFVYVVAGKRVERRDLSTGISNWDRTEVVSGVREGEDVVTTLEIKELSPGSRVGIRVRK
ncbi:MAG: efflux RND transporter periplasmic adaptor subunit [Deltaproteobacteria bacterium]|nr:MAG: efflux RND transporter periplasmic adaptor subunit [Deltaproteobacteria bacterium]